MKIKNMPERVTKRRAEAFRRLTGALPEGYSVSVSDTKFRLGKAKRMKVAQKFL